MLAIWLETRAVSKAAWRSSSSYHFPYSLPSKVVPDLQKSAGNLREVTSSAQNLYAINTPLQNYDICSTICT